MASAAVYNAIIASAEIEKVWSIISAYNDLPKLHKGIVSSEIISDKSITEVGCIRKLIFADGGWVDEELVRFEPETYEFTYIITKGTMPMTNYRSTLTLTQHSEGVAVCWVGNFDANEGADSDSLGKYISECVYKTVVDSTIELLCMIHLDK